MPLHQLLDREQFEPARVSLLCIGLEVRECLVGSVEEEVLTAAPRVTA